MFDLANRMVSIRLLNWISNSVVIRVKILKCSSKANLNFRSKYWFVLLILRFEIFSKFWLCRFQDLFLRPIPIRGRLTTNIKSRNPRLDSVVVNMEKIRSFCTWATLILHSSKPSHINFRPSSGYYVPFLTTEVRLLTATHGRCDGGYVSPSHSKLT